MATRISSQTEATPQASQHTVLQFSFTIDTAKPSTDLSTNLTCSQFVREQFCPGNQGEVFSLSEVCYERSKIQFKSHFFSVSKKQNQSADTTDPLLIANNFQYSEHNKDLL